jgi:hypothetical protein
VRHHCNFIDDMISVSSAATLARNPSLGTRSGDFCRQHRRRDDSDEVSYHRQAGARDADYQTDERHHGVKDSERPVREERAAARYRSCSDGSTAYPST